MKKFLLVAIVALATVNASAWKPVKKASFQREDKMSLNLKTVPATVQEMQKAQQQAAKFQTIRKNIKAVKKADEKLTITPCFSEWTYHYSPLVGGFMPQMMFDGAGFLATEDGKVYLKPFADINGVLVGTVDEEAENPYSERGGVVITFDCSEPFASYLDEEETEQNLYLLPADVVDFVPVRGSKKTFSAYYFADIPEFYIPSSVTLALFEEDESKTDIFTDIFVARALDLVPQELYRESMSTAKVEAVSYYTDEEDNYDYTHEDAIAYLGYNEEDESLDYMYVKGLGENPNAWAELVADEDDPSKFVLSSDIYMGSYYGKDNQEYLLTSVGLIYDSVEGKWNYNAVQTEDGYAYPSYFKMVDNIDGTSTLKSTDATAYCDLAYYWKNENDEEPSYTAWNYCDVTVTINYEEVIDAVTAVKSRLPQSNVRYNLAGQRVDKNFKGIVIENGKKYIRK